MYICCIFPHFSVFNGKLTDTGILKITFSTDNYGFYKFKINPLLFFLPRNIAVSAINLSNCFGAAA